MVIGLIYVIFSTIAISNAHEDVGIADVFFRSLNGLESLVKSVVKSNTGIGWYDNFANVGKAGNRPVEDTCSTIIEDEADVCIINCKKHPFVSHADKKNCIDIYACLNVINSCS